MVVSICRLTSNSSAEFLAIVSDTGLGCDAGLVAVFGVIMFGMLGATTEFEASGCIGLTFLPAAACLVVGVTGVVIGATLVLPTP